MMALSLRCAFSCVVHFRNGAPLLLHSDYFFPRYYPTWTFAHFANDNVGGLCAVR